MLLFLWVFVWTHSQQKCHRFNKDRFINDLLISKFNTCLRKVTKLGNGFAILEFCCIELELRGKHSPSGNWVNSPQWVETKMSLHAHGRLKSKNLQLMMYQTVTDQLWDVSDIIYDFARITLRSCNSSVSKLRRFTVV